MNRPEPDCRGVKTSLAADCHNNPKNVLGTDAPPSAADVRAWHGDRIRDSQETAMAQSEPSGPRPLGCSAHRGLPISGLRRPAHRPSYTAPLSASGRHGSGWQAGPTPCSSGHRRIWRPVVGLRGIGVLEESCIRSTVLLLTVPAVRRPWPACVTDWAFRADSLLNGPDFSGQPGLAAWGRSGSVWGSSRGAVRWVVARLPADGSLGLRRSAGVVRHTRRSIRPDEFPAVPGAGSPAPGRRVRRRGRPAGTERQPHPPGRAADPGHPAAAGPPAAHRRTDRAAAPGSGSPSPRARSRALRAAA